MRDFNLTICSLSIMKRDILFPIFDRKGIGVLLVFLRFGCFTSIVMSSCQSKSENQIDRADFCNGAEVLIHDLHEHRVHVKCCVLPKIPRAS